MTTIKQVDKFIESAKEECADKIISYLTPIIKKEFEKVRKKNPRLQRIAWGNGGYAFYFNPEGVGQDDHWWHGPSQLHFVPKYAHRLIELVCIVSDETGGLYEDISV